jgi:hypothetical protein
MPEEVCYHFNERKGDANAQQAKRLPGRLPLLKDRNPFRKEERTMSVILEMMSGLDWSKIIELLHTIEECNSFIR